MVDVLWWCRSRSQLCLIDGSSNPGCPLLMESCAEWEQAAEAALGYAGLIDEADLEFGGVRAASLLGQTPVQTKSVSSGVGVEEEPEFVGEDAESSSLQVRVGVDLHLVAKVLV